MGVNLETINRIARNEFVELLGGIYEHSSWVASEAFALVPFDSPDQLHQQMAAIVAGSSKDHRLALLRAHPELAGKEAAAGDLTQESKREQAAAGLDQCTAEELSRIEGYNRDYREKCGFPFIIAVSGLNKQQIIAAMAARVENDPATEFDTALAELDNFVKANDYCKFWWLPYTDKIQVYTFNKTTRPRGGFGFTGFMDRTGISGILFTSLMGLGRAVPSIIPFLNNTIQTLHFHPRRRVDRSDRVIKVSSGIPVHQETEYAIPIESAAKAIDDTRSLILKSDAKVNFPLEVRFVAKDDIYMSPAYKRDTCFIGPYVASRKWATPIFDEFEALIGDFAGRPHWGKTFNIGGEELRALYPAYDTFNQLRAQCDPHDLFRNSFVDRVFPA